MVRNSFHDRMPRTADVRPVDAAPGSGCVWIAHVRPAVFVRVFFLAFVALLPVRAFGQFECVVSAPDSIFFDKVDYNRYVPAQFTALIRITNRGPSSADSVVLFARSNTRFTVVPPATQLLAVSFRPGDTLNASFDFVVNPRETNGVDTLIIAVSAKAGARGEWHVPIWVEKEYRPENVIVCPPVATLRVAFVDSLNDYIPNAVAVPVSVYNIGDAPSKDTRIIFVATPGVAPAGGQDPILELGQLDAGDTAVRVFSLVPVRRSNDTTVELRFKAQGRGGLGDRLIDTTCSTTMTIPAARDAVFDIDCRSAPVVRFENGAYVPNPFPWTVHVRNAGSATAKDVHAILTASPALYPDSTSGAYQPIGSMTPGEERDVQWSIHARFVDHPDTAVICATVLDAFNRSATCCDTVILPAVLAPNISARCNVLPDSIFIDGNTGAFLPDRFSVRLDVTNTGSDVADSVRLDLIFSDPDLEILGLPQASVLLATPLQPLAVATTTWTLAPHFNPLTRAIPLLIRVSGPRLEERTAVCSVFVSGSLTPSLECSAATVPFDTVHFDPSSLSYEPLSITASVRNTGMIGANNVEATVLPPSRIALAPGEDPIRRRGSDPLLPDSVWTVHWQLSPLASRDGDLDTFRVEFRTGSVRTQCDDWIFVVGIPPVTVLRIPGNVVQRYGGTIVQPIEIDNTDTKNITRIDLSVQYESTKLDFLGFDLPGTLLENDWDFVPSNRPGVLSFSAETRGTPLSGEGTLANMRFQVLFGTGEDILKTTFAPLIFDSLSSAINRGGVLVRYYNGTVVLSGDCLYPLEAGQNFVIENAPNPFNPTTVITYRLPTDGFVSLGIYDALGRTAATAVSKFQLAGTYRIPFDAGNLPTGVYYCVLRMNGTAISHRMVLNK
jgi:hypothetical protein